ncbi:helix-turn-helix domain-containing protein [Paenibacillus sp. J2TS4]|uniref:helix-turn-helix domain-containing protein n=1 Tax=Paenibacillus sp. J2TS4 TaxID=2807194 RepID=UPI001B2B7C38|nr:AraC family transcriptional regulator [Paenibacillus sp. J2TS4]GIP31245.1 hypothetical protein J2TS4_04550 [Paenibacillus sp. J2TS4]
MQQIWQFTPVLHTHVYWNRKAEFLYETDTYNQWCLFVVENGSFAYGIGESKGEASSGSLVFCPPNVPFQRRTITPLSFHMFMFNWAWADPAFEESPAGMKLEFLLAGKVAIRDINRLKSICAYLRSLPITAEPSVRFWKNHLLGDCWLMYCAEQHPALLPTGKATEDPLMDQAALMIRQKALGPLNLGTISASLGLTPVQFSRKFHAAYQTTPVDYLISIRLNQACALLRESDLTLDEIAERCGYQNGYYISRLFTQKLNMTPSEFRRTNRV